MVGGDRRHLVAGALFVVRDIACGVTTILQRRISGT
jgi:hypothetical protein